MFPTHALQKKTIKNKSIKANKKIIKIIQTVQSPLALIIALNMYKMETLTIGKWTPIK
jgi:hypothetical protein